MSRRYVDVASVLDGSLTSPATSVGGRRDDGTHLLYAGAVNGLVGPPESGKTIIATAMSADQLFAGGSVLWLDLDHNGPRSTVARFRQFGVGGDVLADLARFRLAIPEDADEVLGFVHDAAAWAPTMVVVDSIGELLPMFGANSNDADDFTHVNRQVMAALAGYGCAVLTLDHETKSAQANRYGATGTGAKKRTVDGAYLRVSCVTPFVPGYGGSASLTIVKDRHGHLRTAAPRGHSEPMAAMFELTAHESATSWAFRCPTPTIGTPAESDDVQRLLALSPRPKSVREAQQRMHVSSERARVAMQAIRGIPETPRNVTETTLDGAFPVTTPLRGDGETPSETEAPTDSEDVG